MLHEFKICSIEATLYYQSLSIPFYDINFAIYRSEYFSIPYSRAKTPFHGSDFMFLSMRLCIQLAF